MNTQTLAPQDVKKGQTVVAVDGHDIRPLTVKGAPELDGATWTIKYEIPAGSVLDAWNHYLEPGQTVTVEVPEPKAKREAVYPREVVLHGYRLRMLGPGYYETPDGRFGITQQVESFVCDGGEPHPARYSKRDKAYAAEQLAKPFLYRNDREVYTHVLAHKGYWCSGENEYHDRIVWRPWDNERDTWPDDQPVFPDTLWEALGSLPDEYRTV